NAFNLDEESERVQVEEEANRGTEERLLDMLAPPPVAMDEDAPDGGAPKRNERTREKMRKMLAAGDLDQRKVEITTEHKAQPMMFTGMGMENMDVDLQGMFE